MLIGNSDAGLNSLQEVTGDKTSTSQGINISLD